MDSDNPAAGVALTAKGDLDTQRPQERLSHFPITQNERERLFMAALRIVCGRNGGLANGHGPIKSSYSRCVAAKIRAGI